MTNDIVALIEYYEREKQLEPERILAALQYAFLSAYRKMVPGADNIEELRADIDTKKGGTKIYANLTVVADDDYIDKFNEVPISTAQKVDPSAELEGKVEFNVTPANFDRIAVQTAKQTMMQRLRMAEKEMMYEEFKDRAGEIVSGTVRRFEKNDVLVDVGKFEGRMPNRERVSTEDYNVGDRIRCYVVEVRNDNRGPEIVLSRSHPNFVRRLFEAEVTEIADRSVEIKAIAREAGYRTKIAVWSDDDRLDPVGACVGMRGARVKNIVRELNNEKVDIIRWDDDLATLVADALKPAELQSINIDKEGQVINVTVKEDDLSKAIGRRGQNARLTSRLLGWDVQVKKDETKQEQFEARLNSASHNLAEELGISDDIADHLYRAGGVDANMITQMPVDYIASVVADLEGADADAIFKKAQEVTGTAS